MRRALALLAVAGAGAGLAATIGSAARVTHDVLPVLVPARSPGSQVELVLGWQTTGAPSVPSLKVFRRPATPRDHVPSPWRLFAQAMHGDLTRSRLLLSIHGTRIYGFPDAHHELCFVRVPPTAASGCTRRFLDGAYPQVDAWSDAWGIVDDAATRVDVDGVRATLGENAFYSPLPRDTPTPARITVYERGGLRHVYDIRPCPVGGGPLLC